MSRKIKKYFELSEIENTMYQNLWISVKTATRGKFVAMNTYFKKERSKIKKLNFHFRKLEKQIKSEISKRKHIQIRAQINENKNVKSKRNHCDQT
jgi:hypothetical protein